MRLFLILVFLWSAPAYARVFDFKNESFASYLRGTGGLSGVGDSPYGNASGTSTLFSDNVNYNIGAEVGFLLALEGKLALRVGAEILRARAADIDGKNSSGTKLMTMTSDTFVFNPSATVEFSIFTENESKLFVFGGAGISNVRLDNTYTLTAAGEAAYGAGDYTEKSETNLVSAHGGVGYELLFVDNVTACFELGYRHMPGRNLAHKANSTTLAQGSVTKGSAVLNHDGSDRIIDLSGAYAAIGFRFYIGVF